MPKVKEKVSAEGPCCPSCGGHVIGTLEYKGKTYPRCETIVHKDNGLHGARRKEWDAPCGFWTTKESAWQPKTSS